MRVAVRFRVRVVVGFVRYRVRVAVRSVRDRVRVAVCFVRDRLGVRCGGHFSLRIDQAIASQFLFAAFPLVCLVCLDLGAELGVTNAP